jgi:hypothetical protein
LSRVLRRPCSACPMDRQVASSLVAIRSATFESEILVGLSIPRFIKRHTVTTSSKPIFWIAQNAETCRRRHSRRRHGAHHRGHRLARRISGCDLRGVWVSRCAGLISSPMRSLSMPRHWTLRPPTPAPSRRANARACVKAPYTIGLPFVRRTSRPPAQKGATWEAPRRSLADHPQKRFVSSHVGGGLPQLCAHIVWRLRDPREFTAAERSISASKRLDRPRAVTTS